MYSDHDWDVWTDELNKLSGTDLRVAYAVALQQACEEA